MGASPFRSPHLPMSWRLALAFACLLGLSPWQVAGQDAGAQASQQDARAQASPQREKGSASQAPDRAQASPQEAAEPPREPSHAARFSRFAVAADEPRASAVGARILAEGGSAADAAAATMLTLGVTSPGSSGLGGGGFGLYYDASTKQVVFLDFRERAPGAASADMFVRAEAEGKPQASRVGGLASGVPGEAAGLDALLERFGKLPREQVVAPAARLAAQGVAVSEHVARLSQWAGKTMASDPLGQRWFGDGEPKLKPGQIIRNPALAETIRSLTEPGAPAFYRGRIAREIVRANRKAGGVITTADLAAYQVAEREPLEDRHFGFRWVTAPPPSAGGYTLLASLAMLERWLPTHAALPDPALSHALVESFKGPFLDRRRYFGDPDHLDIPLSPLLDPARLAARANVFHPTLAQLPARYALPLEPDGPALEQPEDHGTSHLCVVDEAGNVAAITTTINLPFGARYSAAGMWMNDEMDDFAREVGVANAFGLRGGAPNLPGPGHRPVSTMSPTIVFDAEGPVLCVGGSGGSRIVTAVAQVALANLVREVAPGEAVARPRVHHQAEPNAVFFEEDVPQAILEQLRARGHALQPQPYGANVQLIRIYREPRHLQAASDPRKGGAPAGE